jgi:hypothetical protein
MCVSYRLFAAWLVSDRGCLRHLPSLQNTDILDERQESPRRFLVKEDGSCALLSALLVVLWVIGSSSAFAQIQTTGRPLETLEQEFTDPLTTLPQVFLKDAYSPTNYGTHVQTNQLITRAIIPRIPPNTLLPFVQLVRPTFSLVTVPSPGGGTRTEFGDMQLFDLAVPPWPAVEKGFRFGLGPTFVFPIATSKSAGQGAWQAGPAVAAVYTGVPGFLAGFLLQNPISFAYTSAERMSQNTLAFQPALLLHLWDSWYLRSADATWAYGWHRHSPTLLPLSLGIGRVLVHPGLPPLNFYVSAQWMVYHQYSPVTSKWSVNFGVTIGFPGVQKR